MKKLICICVIISVIVSMQFTISYSEDLPLSGRIENLQKTINTLETEKKSLNEKWFKLFRDKEKIPDLIYKLRRAAGGKGIILTVRIITESVELLTTEWKEVINKYRDTLTGNSDNIYYIRSNEEYAKLLRGDLELIKDLEITLSNMNKKLDEINSRIDEINKSIEENHKELKRLKDLYKKATGEDYVSETSGRHIDNIGLNSLYGAKTVENGISPDFISADEALKTGYSAAIANNQQKISADGFTLSNPELIWTNSSGNTFIYRSILIPKPWNGTFEDAKNRYINSEAYDYVVQKNDKGKYFLKETKHLGNSLYNRLPDIKIAFNDTYLARGFQTILHADILDADNDDVDVTWFIKTTSGYVQIGKGINYKWDVPANQPSGNIWAVAVDSKGGTQYAFSSYWVKGDYEYIPQNVKFQVIPETPTAGEPATIIARFAINVPSDVEVEWNYKAGTDISYTPGSTDIDSFNTVFSDKAIEEGYSVISDKTQHNYKSYFTFIPDKFTAKNEPIYNYKIIAKIKSGARSNFFNTAYHDLYVPLTNDHIKESQKNKEQLEQEKAITIVNNLKISYDEIYNKYKLNLDNLGEYAFKDTLDFPGLVKSSKEYADSRLGITKAYIIDGNNLTYSNFKNKISEYLSSLKIMCQKLGLNNPSEIDTALNIDASNYERDDIVKYQLKVVVSNFPQIKTLILRRNELNESYEKAFKSWSEMNEIVKTIDKSKLAFNWDTLPIPDKNPGYYNREALAIYEDYENKLKSDMERIPGKDIVNPEYNNSNNEIKIEVNGSNINMDSKPRIINNRTMVPIRFIAESLNCKVEWRKEDSAVIITSPGNNTTAPLKENGVLRVIVDGKEIQSDAPPMIIENRTMVPVRFVSEALGAKVEWDGVNKTVYIERSN